MPKLGIFCVRRVLSVAGLTDFGKAACVSLLLVLSCVLSPAFAQDASAGCTPDEGSGSSSSPYRIDTLCELQGIRSSSTAYYELVANIDASETEGWNDGAGFEPIALNENGGFSGSFVNAGKYEISSLTISRSYRDFVGLFSSLAEGATIRGIILVGSSTTGGHEVGSLVGRSEGMIVGCSVTDSVVGGGDTVGGLVGRQQTGSSISNSYATGSVSGDSRVGGLVGYTLGTLSNSYATGSVVGGPDGVGGLVGRLSAGGISNSYATGSVSGQERAVGGLVGLNINGSIANSYYAARGQNNDFGTERTFTQLRCPTMSSATCSLSGSDQGTYQDWDTSVWDFGSAADLPQLSSNRNSELNLKPYINGSADLVVGTGYPGITRFSLEADYPGSPGESVVLTWSLLFDEPSTLSDFVYFELEDGTTSTEANVSAETLAVVRDGLMEGKGFYVVLKNNISASDDRIRVRIEKAKQPYIRSPGDIPPATIGSTTTFSFSVGYAGPAEQSVTLTWSLSGVPDSLRDFVYFDLGDGKSSTTFTDGAKLTDSASPVTLVVVGNQELAGRSFYVVLKNNVSANDDLVRVQVEGEPPNILRDDDISPALVGRTTTFSFSVEYTGSAVPSILTWSLSGVPFSLRHLVYFDTGGGSTSTTFTDSAKLTGTASMVTLVVVGNEELAGRSFYVVLKNNVSASDDRVQVRTEIGPPNIVRDDDIRPAPVGSTTTYGFSVGYTGSSDPVTLTWSLSDVPSTLRHLVYFDLGGGTTSEMFIDSTKLTSSASPVTLVVVGDEGLEGRSFYVVLKNNVVASDDRVRIQVRPEEGPPDIVRVVDIRPAPIGRTTTFGFSVGYTGSLDPVTLTWSLSGVPFSLRHLVYFDLAGDTTGTTFTDPAKLTGSASTVTLVVVGNKELAGRSFYVVLKNNNSASDDRVQVRTEVGPPNIVQDDDIRPVPIGSTTTFGFSVGYTGSSDPVTLTWSLSDVPSTLRRLVYFDLGDGTTGTTVTDSAKLTSSASPVTLVIVGDEGLEGRSFYVVLKNNVAASDDRVQVLIEEDTPNVLGGDDSPVPIGSTTTFSFSVGYTGSSDPVTLTWSLSGVPTSLRHFVYFRLADGTTSEMFIDSSVRTTNASPVTLVVVGNEGLAGISFYVVLKNSVVANEDRVQVQVQGLTAIRLRVKVYLGGAVR